MTMRMPRFTIRRMMVVVAIVGMGFGIADSLTISARTARYRRIADAMEQRELRCRRIDAMDPTMRAKNGLFDIYMENPDWNRKMIPYFASLKKKYRHAAAHPRIPVAPDPPSP